MLSVKQKRTIPSLNCIIVCNCIGFQKNAYPNTPPNRYRRRLLHWTLRKSNYQSKGKTWKKHQYFNRCHHWARKQGRKKGSAHYRQLRLDRNKRRDCRKYHHRRRRSHCTTCLRQFRRSVALYCNWKSRKNYFPRKRNQRLY